MSVADEEQVAEHLDLGPLLARAEQSRHRLVEMLAEEVEDRRLKSRDRMNRHPEVKRLQSTPAGIPIGEGLTDGREQLFVATDLLSDEKGRRVLDRLPDLLTARHLAETGMTGAVCDQDDRAGEERPVCPAQVEQHAVMTGDRHDANRFDDGGHFQERRPCGVLGAVRAKKTRPAARTLVTARPYSPPWIEPVCCLSTPKV